VMAGVGCRAGNDTEGGAEIRFLTAPHQGPCVHVTCHQTSTTSVVRDHYSRA
jgi:hypothetical protein